MTSEAWERYSTAADDLPLDNWNWPLRGEGLAYLGQGGAPECEPLPTCGPDEVLVRVDAVSLCSSDAKMMRLGARYPLFYGRDLTRDPVRLGHEVALTVMQVGERRRRQFRRGQRLGLQPDVFTEGRRTCFGVLIPGGLTQYLTLGARVLDGESPGGYVFPVPDALSYADVALLEPWACVDAAFAPRRRLDLRRGGLLLIAGRKGDETAYHMQRPLPSAKVLLAHVPASLSLWVRRQNVEVVELQGDDWVTAAAAQGLERAVDDIILLDPQRGSTVTEASRLLAPEGTLALVCDGPLDGRAQLDVGRIHYEFLAYMGCRGPLIDAAYGEARNRSELRQGGVAWIAGAGGPMGRMHVQRALEQPDGPRVVIATNRGADRLEELQRTYGALAAAHGKQFFALNPLAEPQRLAALCAELTGGRGLDDAVVVAADLGLMEEAVGLLAPDGMLSLFAGLPLGNLLSLRVENVALHGAQFTGTSGSSLDDQARVVQRALAGQISPAHSVAAIGGLDAAAEGLQAVIDRRFAGKVLLFPHLRDLPLLGLDELSQALPRVHACLGQGETWNGAAERALFETLLAADKEHAPRRDA